ncbi:MAG: glycosyltransferase family 4 protein [Candidatus Krumholzibacteria bacterium]|nr:glycosyltransferase family 4 protein [Candidatus Krumholzibacteria bacterium]
MRIGMMMKWKIPPPNVRVQNEALTLAAEGHEVHFLIEGRRGEPREETVGGVHVVRGVRMGRLGDIRHRYTFNFTYRDPVWTGAIDRFAKERLIDVLHVNDLPLAMEAVSAGRRLRLPVVADLHENYPAGLQVWYTNALKRATIYNYDRWSRYERAILREVDAIIVVIEEARDRLLKLGLGAEKIFVVPNTVSESTGAIRIDGDVLARYRGAFVVSYIGNFAPHRGLDTVIAALPLARQEIPNLRLVLVGDHNDGYRRRLERLVRDLHCGDIVEMTGWKSQDAIWSYIEASAVCLVPHARNPHTDTTIPNKIFQYMMRERPVIVSDCPPLARIASDTGGGLVFRWNDPAELARCIVELHQNEGKRLEMGAAGRRAVLQRYTWEKTSGPLVELYRRLASAKRT